MTQPPLPLAAPTTDAATPAAAGFLLAPSAPNALISADAPPLPVREFRTPGDLPLRREDRPSAPTARSLTQASAVGGTPAAVGPLAFPAPHVRTSSCALSLPIRERRNRSDPRLRRKGRPKAPAARALAPEVAASRLVVEISAIRSLAGRLDHHRGGRP